MNIDERLEALTMNLELGVREIEEMRKGIGELHKLVEQDAENIRGLVRVAEIHEHRLSRVEGHLE